MFKQLTKLSLLNKTRKYIRTDNYNGIQVVSDKYLRDKMTYNEYIKFNKLIEGRTVINPDDMNIFDKNNNTNDTNDTNNVNDTNDIYYYLSDIEQIYREMKRLK